LGCLKLTYHQTSELKIVYSKKELISKKSSLKGGSALLFGMIQPNSNNLNIGDHNYGFNGMEKDDEIQGTGNSLDFGARMYNSRLGRWFAKDPKSKSYPSYSPYEGIGNNPIVFGDPDGKDITYKVTERLGKNPLIEIVVSGKVIDLSSEWFLIYSHNSLAKQLSSHSLEAHDVDVSDLDFNGNKYRNADIKVSFDFKGIDHMSEVGASDHLIVVADFHEKSTAVGKKIKESKALGIANFKGGMVSFVKGDITGFDSGLRTALHEFWQHQFLAEEDPAFTAEIVRDLGLSGGKGLKTPSEEFAAGLDNLMNDKLNLFGATFQEDGFIYPQGFDGFIHSGFNSLLPTLSGVLNWLDISSVRTHIKSGIGKIGDINKVGVKPAHSAKQLKKIRVK